ncbi:MAG: methyltransferase domain-containing protein [Lachnospiraceae bacterium]|nr:methyltransferase domain-containing protein [Lachnospiraceae bacterium]
MADIVQMFIDQVSEKDELQNKYLRNWSVTDSEKEELNIILTFFMEELHYDLDFIVETYLFINNMVMEETYYFIRHGRYRYSTFAEVNKLVYDNHEYMEKYMMGLSISDYIWTNHIKMLRYFEKNSTIFTGERYLEIGPGFGQYLVKAILNCNFHDYSACDVSKTSVEGTNRFLNYRNLAEKCTVQEKNFFEYTSDEKFDCIVMGEVLEHVEEPMQMLRKINDLLEESGKAFITTVINAPTLDHIYLFGSIEEVLDMAREAGFGILDYTYATEGDIALEKAKKRKQTINIAMILEKQQKAF